MILTVTLNTSVDMRFVVHDFQPGGVFRAMEDQQTAGGKGLNVTRVLKQLQAPVLATGLVGGKNGEFIQEQLDGLGINHSFVSVQGNTRVCIAVLDGDVQTEVLGRGPRIAKDELERFFQEFQRLAQQAKIVCISGSIPPSVPDTVYADMVELAWRCGCKVILDSSGPALAKALSAQPFLVKPNEDELRALVGRELNSQEDIVLAMKDIAGRGVEVVVVSQGAKGALVHAAGRVYSVKAPQVKAVNPVGSGDAMVAGFAHGIHGDWELERTLAWAAACGVANAMEAQTGYVQPDNVQRLLEAVEVEKY